MQELTSAAQFMRTEQGSNKHKTRARHVMKDTFTVLSVMAERNPFSPDANRRKIMNRVNAGSAVNVDTAKAIGERIPLSMFGQSAANYTFKCSAQAVLVRNRQSGLTVKWYRLTTILASETCFGLQQFGRFGVHIRLRIVQLPNCSI